MSIKFINKNTSKIQQFETIEEITNVSANEEGKLAIVYGEKISAMTEDTQVQIIIFPETVLLPEAISSSASCMLRAVDSSVGYFDGYASLSATSFSFEGYTESGELIVRYTSTDGITYTRTTTEEIVDCGTLIYPYSWNDNFGYFMQNKVKKFDGLFEFRKNVPDENYRRFFTGIKYNSELNAIESRYTENVYATDIISHIYNATLQNYETKGLRDFICKFYDIVDGQPTKCRMFYTPYSYLAVAKYPEYENAILLLGVDVTTESKNLSHFDIDLITGKVSEIVSITRNPNAIGTSGYAYFYLEAVEEDAYYAIVRTNTSDNSTWQIAFESYEFRTYIDTYSSKSVGKVTYGLFDKFVKVN